MKLDEPKQNRYKEAVPNKAIGVKSCSGKIITSGETWSLHRRGETPRNSEAVERLSAFASLSRSDEALSVAGTAHPRSAVNNCTDWVSEAQEWIEENWQKSNSRPVFNYPKVPAVSKNQSLLEKISVEVQPIAELLLQNGININMVPGYVKRIRAGKDVRINGKMGYKLYKYPDGTKALTEIPMVDPDQDWFEDEPDEFDIDEPIFRADSSYKIVNGKLVLEDVA